MEETSEDLPNFSIGIDLLGHDPTSSKNKAEFKKSRKFSRFANLSISFPEAAIHLYSDGDH